MPEQLLENGILAIQHLEKAIADGVIIADRSVAPGQLQPASLDLRLGVEAWRVQASFLPGQHMTVLDKLQKFGMHKIDLSDGAVLERGCVYIVKLQESLALPAGIAATANPKSSTGRLDIFTRLITDFAREFGQSLLAIVARFTRRYHREHFRFWCAPGRAWRNTFAARPYCPIR